MSTPCCRPRSLSWAWWQIAVLMMLMAASWSDTRSVTLAVSPMSGETWVAHQASGSTAALNGEDPIEGLAAVSDHRFSFFRARSGSVTLPVEVMGPAGSPTTEIVELECPDPSDVTHLYLRLHRGAYRDASVNLERQAKASIRINHGDWIDLGNETTTAFAHEAAWGGLDGAYASVRLTVPVNGLQAGSNSIAFRFNGHDTFSIGYRVIEMDLLRSDSSSALAVGTFVQDDPTAWTPIHGDSTSLSAGEDLWHRGALTEYPGGPAIAASCADCHARDGRDMAYFAFSDHSLIERSRFHGLSQHESELIASYIRSLDVAPHGRPWNPPYQPGPGLDDRPVEEWAAGAGLEAVLEHDDDLQVILMPGGVPDSNTLAPGGSINHRELPVAMQYPDWMAWLPEVHPKDVAGIDYYNGDVEGVLNTPHGEYEEMHEHFSASDWQQGIAQMSHFGARTGRAGGRIKDDTQTYSDPEAAGRSIRHWASVKMWEVVQMYGLEGRAHELLGSQVDARSWLSWRRNVFELAPHRTALDNQRLSFQSIEVSKYFSTAWYQLQVSINSGRGMTDTWKLAPVDWNYQPSHIGDLERYNGITHPYRYLATMALQHQINLFHGPSNGSFNVKQMHPARYAPLPRNDGGFNFRIFRNLEAADRNAAYAALLNSLMDLYEYFPTTDWQRRADASNTGDDGTVEPIDHIPVLVTDMSLSSAHHQNRWADSFYTAVHNFRAAGVDQAVLDRMIDWGAQMWPNGDWEGLRAISN